MRRDVSVLCWWFTVHCMLTTYNTKCIIFNTTRNSFFLDFLKYRYVNFDVLNCQYVYIKYLGSIVETRLTCKKKSKYLLDNSVYIIILYNLRYVYNNKLLKTIYYALVNSKLEYGLNNSGRSMSHSSKTNNNTANKLYDCLCQLNL